MPKQAEVSKIDSSLFASFYLKALHHNSNVHDLLYVAEVTVRHATVPDRCTALPRMHPLTLRMRARRRASPVQKRTYAMPL